MATGVVQKYADGTDTGWTPVSVAKDDATTFYGTIYWRRVGCTVTVVGYQIKLKSALTTSAVVLLRNLPPSITTTNTFCGNVGQQGMMNVSGAGNLTFYKLSSDSSYPADTNINFTVTYLTK